MTSTRLSFTFLTVATLAGALGLSDAFGDSGSWMLVGGLGTALRAVCLGALLAFLVSFLVSLNQSPLLGHTKEASIPSRAFQAESRNRDGS